MLPEALRKVLQWSVLGLVHLEEKGGDFVFYERGHMVQSLHYLYWIGGNFSSRLLTNFGNPAKGTKDVEDTSAHMVHRIQASHF